LAVDPNSVMIVAGHSRAFAVTGTPRTFTGDVTLSCGALPANMTCSFSQSSLNLAGGTVQSTLTIFTVVPPRFVTSVFPQQNGNILTAVAMGLATMMPVFGIFLAGQRAKRHKT